MRSRDGTLEAGIEARRRAGKRRLHHQLEHDAATHAPNCHRRWPRQRAWHARDCRDDTKLILVEQTQLCRSERRELLEHRRRQCEQVAIARHADRHTPPNTPTTATTARASITELFAGGNINMLHINVGHINVAKRVGSVNMLCVVAIVAGTGAVARAIVDVGRRRVALDAAASSPRRRTRRAVNQARRRRAARHVLLAPTIAAAAA